MKRRDWMRMRHYAWRCERALIAAANFEGWGDIERRDNRLAMARDYSTLAFQLAREAYA
jgi:hypothetical protein